MKKFHYLLLAASIVIALYELLLIIIYRDISLSKLVMILSIILGIYSYLYIIEKMPKLITVIVMVILVSFIFIEGKIVYYSFDHTTTSHYDTIVILGAQVRNGAPSPALQYRIEKAKEYLNEDTIFVASGGQGTNESMSEALCIKTNLDPDNQYNILLEDESTSTEENLIFSSHYMGSKVGIISNSFHLYRVHLMCERLDIEAEMIPAKNHLITYPHFLIREYFGVLEEYAARLRD